MTQHSDISAAVDRLATAVLRDTDDLCAVLGIDYTDEQLAAITAPLEPGVIVAGAGSGKTTVMAARVVWLVGRGAAAPDQVLGLTFTNKAAAELAERVRAALERAGLLGGAASDPMALRAAAPDDADLDREFGEPTILTYHAYADRLLKEHGLRLGVEPSARLLADASRFQVAAQVVRAARGPFEYLRGQVAELAADVAQLDGDLCEHLVSLERLRAFDESFAACADALAGKRGYAELVKAGAVARGRIELAGLVAGYREAKRSRGLIDFADQMALGARLAEERAEVGVIERDKYPVVLLDEYQDTSVAQRRMLVGLFGGRGHGAEQGAEQGHEQHHEQADDRHGGYGGGHPVTAVGDPCQSIYGWRGASVANLDDFPRHFPTASGRPAVRYTLTENRRSGGHLLSYANQISEPLRAIHQGVSELRPSAAKASGGWISCALTDSYADELNWIGEQVVRQHHEHGVPWSQIAVLVRVGRHIPQLYAELHGRGVPVEVVGLSGLLDLPEIADLVAMLHVIDEPIANTSLVRLLTGPRWRIGPRDLALLGIRARQLVAGPASDGGDALERAVARVDATEVVSLSDAMDDLGDELPFSAEASRRFAAFAAEIRALRRQLSEPLLDVLHRIMTVTGLDVEIAAAAPQIEARCAETVEAFLGCAHAWLAGAAEQDGDSSVTAFRAYLAAAARHERGLDVDLPAAGESVKLLTMHKAKGLEWDVVVVPHLVRDAVTRGRARWTASRAALPTPLRGDAEHLPALAEPGAKADFTAYEQATRDHDALEDRRLAYVTFTRPRARLIASGHWWGPTQKRALGPHQYLVELAEHCRAGNGQVEAWAEEPAADATNPRLGAREDRWPVPLDPDALRRRREAATLVQQAMRRRAAADAGPVTASVPAQLSTDEARLVASWDNDLDALVRELRQGRQARRTAPMPSSLTATQILAMAKDPDGFARDLVRPMPRPPAPRARRGTRFHAWLESSIGQRPLLDPDDLPGAADADLDAEPRDDADLERLKAAFERTPYAGRVPHLVEHPFQIVLAGQVIRGRIDAIYRVPPDADDGHPGHRYQVVDWKTGSAASADPLQLAIYRLAWAETIGVAPDAVDAVFVHIRDARVERPADLPDRAALEELLRPMLGVGSEPA